MNNETKIIFAYRCPREYLTEINNDISYAHTSHLIHEKKACVRLTAWLNLNYSVRRSVGSHPALACNIAGAISRIVVCRILLYIHGTHTAASSGVKDTIKNLYM